MSKKPNKQQHLWIRKETAGSGKKALRLIDAVRYTLALLFINQAGILDLLEKKFTITYMITLSHFPQIVKNLTNGFSVIIFLFSRTLINNNS